MKRIIRIFIIIFFVINSLVSDSQGIDSLQNIQITISFSEAPTTFSVEKAPLRFNKTFAFSYQMDDGSKDIYTHGYPYFKGGMIDTTSYPGLKFTDGCGNDLNFTMSSSLFSFSTNQPGGIDLHDPTSPYAIRYVTWPELNEMYKDGWGISNHGLSSKVDGNYSDLIARNESYVKLQTQAATPGGVDMGIFVNPNGVEAFTPLAFDQGLLVCYREGYKFGVPSFDVNSVWDQQNIKMGRTNTYTRVNLSKLVDGIANASIEGANHWGVAFTHSIVNPSYGYAFSDFTEHMDYVANRYGKNGLDNIWMATEEEVLDYLLVTEAVSVSFELINHQLQITFSGKIPSNYRFYNLSLLINADKPIASITANGVTSFSFKGTGQQHALINISWNER
ncbi:hypothetical protein ACFLS7_01305 [Bacteroidota bacterium]